MHANNNGDLRPFYENPTKVLLDFSFTFTIIVWVMRSCKGLFHVRSVCMHANNNNGSRPCGTYRTVRGSLCWLFVPLNVGCRNSLKHSFSLKSLNYLRFWWAYGWFLMLSVDVFSFFNIWILKKIFGWECSGNKTSYDLEGGPHHFVCLSPFKMGTFPKIHMCQKICSVHLSMKC